MKTPGVLQPLVDQGLITTVVRPLMAGKEAQVYLVDSEGERRVAKVYKEADHRSFKHRSEYTEGRKVRNSRQARAMSKRSKFGREEVEAAWRSAEVDAIYRLHGAGVRVPTPYHFVDGVLIMELVAGEDGDPAPRLVDHTFTPEEGQEVFATLLRETVKMLCAGVVHGDLSDFNVLITPDGPVIIDFPQWVDPAHNRNARKLLIRDVDNLTQFLGRAATSLRNKKYGAEMWDLYERGQLTPDTKLTGKLRKKKQADVGGLLEEIEALERESRARREALGLPPPRRARAPVVYEEKRKPATQPPRNEGPGGEPRSKRKRRRNKDKRGAREDRGPAREERPRNERAQNDRPRKGKPAAKAAADPFDDLDALLSSD